MAGTPAASRANTGSSQQVVKENAGERARSHLNSAFPFLDFADLDAQVCIMPLTLYIASVFRAVHKS